MPQCSILFHYLPIKQQEGSRNSNQPNSLLVSLQVRPALAYSVHCKFPRRRGMFGETHVAVVYIAQCKIVTLYIAS